MKSNGVEGNEIKWNGIEWSRIDWIEIEKSMMCLNTDVLWIEQINNSLVGSLNTIHSHNILSANHTVNPSHLVYDSQTNQFRRKASSTINATQQTKSIPSTKRADKPMLQTELRRSHAVRSMLLRQLEQDTLCPASIQSSWLASAEFPSGIRTTHQSLPSAAPWPQGCEECQ